MSSPAAEIGQKMDRFNSWPDSRKKGTRPELKKVFSIESPESDCKKVTPAEAGDPVEDYTLKSTLESVLRGQISAGTPILTGVSTKNNMMAIDIADIQALRQFAKRTRDPRLKYLTTRSHQLTLPDGEKIRVTARVYLDGVAQSVGKSMSVFTSVKANNLITCRDVLVTWCLGNSANRSKNYKKTYKASLRDLSEADHWQGCLDFLEQEKSCTDSMLVGVMIS